MADPKYKNLPYISLGEKDVYESEDLPEAEQAIAEDTTEDGSVEKLMVDPKDAFARFNKATVDARRVNFSDEVGTTGSARSGYSVNYEVYPPGERTGESLLQRLQCLKCELKELEDLSKTSFDQAESVSPAYILSEIEQLQKAVTDFSEGRSPKAETAAYEKLLNMLKSSPAKPSPSKGKSAGTANEVLYELRYSANVAKAERDANLDARISQLEQLLGSLPDQASALADVSGHDSVMDTLASLTTKVSLLDEDKIDKVTARLQLLHQSLNKVQ